MLRLAKRSTRNGNNLCSTVWILTEKTSALDDRDDPEAEPEFAEAKPTTSTHPWQKAWIRSPSEISMMRSWSRGFTKSRPRWRPAHHLFSDVVGHVAARIHGAVRVANHLRFDSRMVGAEMQRVGIDIDWGSGLDTLSVWIDRYAQARIACTALACHPDVVGLLSEVSSSGPVPTSQPARTLVLYHLPISLPGSRASHVRELRFGHPYYR